MVVVMLIVVKGWEGEKGLLLGTRGGQFSWWGGNGAIGSYGWTAGLCHSETLQFLTRGCRGGSWRGETSWRRHPEQNAEIQKWFFEQGHRHMAPLAHKEKVLGRWAEDGLLRWPYRQSLGWDMAFCRKRWEFSETSETLECINTHTFVKVLGEWEYGRVIS